MRGLSLVVVALLGGFLVPAAAAEIVSSDVDDAALAVAPNGAPRVAVVRDETLSVFARSASGTWSPRQLALPGSSAVVVGAAATRSQTFALVEESTGAWLALATVGTTTRLRVLAVAPAGTSLGTAGLTLDRRGRPVVSWTTLAADGSTFLRFWHLGRVTPITQLGFPQSDVPAPSAPVVLPRGGIHVIEGYGTSHASGAIEWGLEGRKWFGQYLFSSILGAPTGVLRSVRTRSTLVAAWTQGYLGGDDADVVVATHRGIQEASRTLIPHALLVDLASAGTGFEAAANDWVTAGAFGTEAYDVLRAGVVVGSSGTSTEVDGALYGYAVRGATRQFLLVRDGRLEWFRTPTRPQARIRATATRAGACVTVSGTLTGTSGGVVDVYREWPGRTRVLVASVPAAADGSFRAVDPAAVLPAAYRAVYVDPLTSLPLAFLVRTPVP